MPSQSVEEYIESIYRLGGSGGVVSTGDLAVHLGVAAPSVTTMLKRLVRDGLVEHTPYHGITLTKSGKEAAAALIRCHRVSERLLTDIVGLSWDEVHQIACKLEHVITGDLADKVYKALGEPDSCPHGNPMNIEETSGLVQLSEAAPGSEVVVGKITNEEQDFLRYLQEQGIRPGSRLKVISKDVFGDIVSVEIDGVVKALGSATVSSIWVTLQDMQE